MRRAALLAAVLMGWATVPAAGWVALPAHPVAGGGVADCLRAGGPGQLAVLGRQGRGVDLLAVGSQAVTTGTATVFGRLAACPELAGAAGATPALVAPVLHGSSSAPSSVRVADAGSAPVAVGTEAGVDPAPVVAVSPSGAAVVAWSQMVPGPEPIAARVLAAVRPAAGAPFGPAVTLGSGSPFLAQPSVGIDAAGHVTVAWVSRSLLGQQPASVDIASSTDGHSFVTRQLASAAGDQVALAVSPAGRMLVLNYGSDSILAYERAAGASAFAPVSVPASGSPDELAVALADDGGAVIAYRIDSSLDGVGSSVSAFALLRRPRADVFGREQVLEGSTEDSGSFSGFNFLPSINTGSSPLSDDRGAQVAAALDASGRVLLTWVDPGTRRSAASAHVASGTLSGGMAHPVRVGSPCRAANAAQPLTLSDGRLGAAWTDNAEVTSRDGSDTPLAGGLLHVLAPGQPAPSTDGTPPGVSARLIGSPALHGGQPLRLRVRCHGGPCIVRGAATTYPLDGSSGDPSLVDGSIALPRGRAGVLSLDPAAGSTLARAHDAAVQVSLFACTPTGTRATHLALHPRLRRLPPLPTPRVVDLVARRHGSTIVVTWRTSIPARETTFELIGEPFDVARPVYAQIAGHGHRRFAVTLHLAPGVHATTVSVRVTSGDKGNGKSVSARIR